MNSDDITIDEEESIVTVNDGVLLCVFGQEGKYDNSKAKLDACVEMGQYYFAKTSLI
jgi:hypothetical protein